MTGFDPTAILAPPAEWATRGLCREIGGDTWYPEIGDSGTLAKAKQTCAACPVRVDCLEHALTANEQWGIWGGTSRKERQALRRARGLTATDDDVVALDVAA